MIPKWNERRVIINWWLCKEAKYENQHDEKGNNEIISQAKRNVVTQKNLEMNE